MISERTLRNWRRDALTEKNTSIPISITKINLDLSIYLEMQERILRLTQELLDLHLIKKG